MDQKRKNKGIKQLMVKHRYLMMIPLLTYLSPQTATYTVIRKIRTKKRNDSLREDIETETIHHHPESTLCDCCHHQMVEIGSILAREEAAPSSSLQR